MKKVIYAVIFLLIAGYTQLTAQDSTAVKKEKNFSFIPLPVIALTRQSPILTVFTGRIFSFFSTSFLSYRRN